MAAKYARRIHPVPGYTDTENMWEKLLNLETELKRRVVGQEEAAEAVLNDVT